MKERILLIGPWDPGLHEIGARVVASLTDVGSSLAGTDVLGLTLTILRDKRFPALRDHLRELNPGLQLVAEVPLGYPTHLLAELHREHRFDRILKDTTLAEAQPQIYEALERASHLRQEASLKNLLIEQEEKLKNLRGELESRVEKRTRSLAESRHNLHVRNSRLEGLRRTLLIVQEADSLPTMEKSVNDSLAGTVETAWVRIVPVPRDQEFARQIEAMDGFTWLAVQLWRGAEAIGSAFFMRPKDRPFRREDIDFLNKVSEAISLALDQLQKRAEAETLREQWEATFAAISEPIAIIDRQYEVVQMNSAQPSGGLCHQRLFNRDTPCPNCRRGESFRLAENGRIWDVHSQMLSLESHREPLYVNLYSDITERIRIEQRLVESAKMAELGTIGSSIAHELNNPLGGILNFAQLLRMDLARDHAFADDVREIEAGAKRCKEIVEDLLGFTRAPRADELSDFDLREGLRRALSINELRTKSLGIEVQLKTPATVCLIHGHANLVIQSLAGILERARNLILDRRVREPQHRGRIEIELVEHEENFTVQISDDGLPENPSSRHGLALQIAAQILRDQGAQLEIQGPSSPVSTAKISFPRPVFPA